MPLDSAVLDWHPLDVVETPAGPRQRVLLVAARRDMVERVLRAARAAGLKPQGIDVAAFAMIRALHRAEPDGAEDAAVLYLNVGGVTNLAVAVGTTCLFTRVIGPGTEGLAVELAERQALSLEAARSWLVQVGLDEPLPDDDSTESVVAREARSVMEEGVRRIGADARSSLEFQAGQDGQTPAVTRVVLAGAAASIPGFASALGAELALPTEPALLAGAPTGIAPGLLATAVGLAVDEAPADTRKAGRR